MKYKKLEDMEIEIIDGDRGKNYPNGDDFKKEKYCLFLNAKNVTKDGFNFEETMFINKEKDNLLRKGKLKRNDIVLTTRGTVGNVAYYSNDISYENIRINSGMIILRCNSNCINPKYLYYVLKSRYIQNQIKQIKTGSAQPQLPIVILKNIKVNLTSLDIQMKIVTILDSLDKKIKLNNQMNDNLHELAENIFHEIYQSGVESKLENLITSISTGSRPKGGAQNNGIPSIGAEKIEKFGKYDYHSEKYISEDFFNSLKKGIVKSGDVLLYKDGAYTGKVSMALNGFPHNKCAVNEHVFILNTKNNWAKFYLYFILNHHENKTKIFTMASSKAAQPGLNQMELKSLEVKLPSKDKIVAFEKKVAPIMNKIAYNAKENKILEQLRDILLPKLMNGQIDLEKIKI